MLSVIVTIVIIVTIVFMVIIVVIIITVIIIVYSCQLFHLTGDGLVIVNEEIPLFLIERTDVISVIVKERRLPVG